MGDKFSDVGNAIRDFLAGIGDSLVDTVKGLLTLVWIWEFCMCIVSVHG